MKTHRKKITIQKLAALIVVVSFVTGATTLKSLYRKFEEMRDDARLAAEEVRGASPEVKSQGSAGTTGRGVPPGCLQFDESGEQVGLWRDECEKCREGNTFDIACVRQRGIDPFKMPPRLDPSFSTSPQTIPRPATQHTPPEPPATP